MHESLFWFRLGKPKGVDPVGASPVQEARACPELLVMTPKQHESRASTWPEETRYTLTCSMRKYVHLITTYCNCVVVDVGGFELEWTSAPDFSSTRPDAA